MLQLVQRVPRLVLKMAGGCWHSFMRCVGNRGTEPVATRYKTKEVESIKFENLLTLEQRERDSRVPIVNESELQHVREGRLDRLAEEQMKLDRQKDEDLRRQEEQLRLEEEAYYAAKRKAAKKAKQAPITEQPSSKSNGGKKGNLPSWLTDSLSSSLIDSSKKPCLNQLESDDEEDFEIFLKNVKAKNASLTQQSPVTAAKLHSVTSDDEGDVSENEIDFGYWETAATTTPTGDAFNMGEGIRSHENLQEVDLNLL